MQGTSLVGMAIIIGIAVPILMISTLFFRYVLVKRPTGALPAIGLTIFIWLFVGFALRDIFEFVPDFNLQIFGYFFTYVSYKILRTEKSSPLELWPICLIYKPAMRSNDHASVDEESPGDTYFKYREKRASSTITRTEGTEAWQVIVLLVLAITIGVFGYLNIDLYLKNKQPP